MFNIFGHKGNANENAIEILPCYHQEHKQQQILMRMLKKEHVYTFGGNVN
jgi:hypothetical protein